MFRKDQFATNAMKRVLLAQTFDPIIVLVALGAITKTKPMSFKALNTV